MIWFISYKLSFQNQFYNNYFFYKQVYPGYCLPGFRSCGDFKSCYNESKQCDGSKDCDNGADETGCIGEFSYSFDKIYWLLERNVDFYKVGMKKGEQHVLRNTVFW